MSSLKIKVCGIRNVENIRRLSMLKPDLMGFVFYPPSPRYAGAVPEEGMFDSFPPGILRTGVFVNADLYSIKAHILRFGLQVVQLHGNESPALCKRLTAQGIKVIKAFRVSDDTDFSKMMEYVSCCKWFLFDTASRFPGGNGKSFNWKILEKYELGHPFFLSGGIGTADADRILSLRHAALVGVDVNSRFETEPGMKDIKRVERFISLIRGKGINR